MKTALICGISGQDGSYLAQYLLSLNYKVYGLIRRTSRPNYNNIYKAMLNQDFTLIQGDLTDQNSLLRALIQSNPDQVYNLAAQSFVAESFRTPQYTSNVTGLGCLRILEAIRQYDTQRKIKFYNAASSEMYGKMVQNPANENTPFYPRSPYGVSKLYAYWITKNYRQTYNMFNCSGILFNHQSFRRGIQFLPKKITNGIKNIVQGKIKYIQLGNIQAKRDWGAAQKYVQSMKLMLDQDKPDDYVVATGQTHSVKDFLKIAFNYVDINNWEDYIKINPKFYRPCEVQCLRGNASKIKSIGWKYDITFEQLIHNMIDQEFGKQNRIITLSTTHKLKLDGLVSPIG